MNPRRKFCLIHCLLVGSFVLTAPLAARENLISIYEDALASDPEYAAAQAQFAAELEAKPQALAALLPQIGAIAGYRWTDPDYEDANIIFSSIGNTRFDSHNYGVRLDQVLFDRPARIRLHQAEASIARATARAAAARQDLIVRVSEAYFSTLDAYADQQKILAEQHAVEQQLENFQARFDVGMLPITDLQEARARRDLILANKLAADSQLAVSLESLRTLTGRLPETLSTLRADAVMPPPEPADTEAWVNTASESNPEVLAAQQDFRIALQEIDRVRGTRYPTVGLLAQHGQQTNHGGFNEGTTTETTVGLEFRVPIYTGGLISAQIRQAQHLAQASESQLELIQRRAALETRAQYLQVLSFQQQVAAMRQAVHSTKTAADAARSGFEAGTRTSVDVLLAISQNYAAERDYTHARHRLVVASLKLKRAAGAISENDVYVVNSWLSDTP